MGFTDCLQTTLLGETLLSIHVVPGAKQSGLIEYDQWTKSLRIAVKARAEGGKANNALIYVISEILNVPVFKAKMIIPIINPTSAILFVIKAFMAAEELSFFSQ